MHLPVIEEAGMGSIAFCPLEQGLLTGKYIQGIPADSRIAGSSKFMDERALTEEVISKTIKLNKIAKLRGQSLAQMALAWALKQGRLTSVILGASRSSQIKDNVAALDNMNFTDEEMNEIEKILRG